MLLNQVLVYVRDHPRVKWTAIKTMWLVSDCGPHFRSYESAAHYLVTLVNTLKFNVNVLYLGEQRGKGACDRLFGWTNDWLQRYIQDKPVHGIHHLVDAYRSGSAAMALSDPSGPSFLVRAFDPGKFRASPRFSFSCPTLKISRTYSLCAKLNSYAASGITIRNHVFSDMDTGTLLHPWSVIETAAEAEEPWRRGYYDKTRSWEEAGPQAGDVTELTRKYAAQKSFHAPTMPTPKRSLEEKLSAKARALSRQARKRQRQKASRQTEQTSSGSSSTSSSSESATSD